MNHCRTITITSPPATAAAFVRIQLQWVSEKAKAKLRILPSVSVNATLGSLGHPKCTAMLLLQSHSFTVNDALLKLSLLMVLIECNYWNAFPLQSRMHTCTCMCARFTDARAWFIRARQVSDYFANSVPPNADEYGWKRLNWKRVFVARKDQKYVIFMWPVIETIFFAMNDPTLKLRKNFYAIFKIPLYKKLWKNAKAAYSNTLQNQTKCYKRFLQ